MEKCVFFKVTIMVIFTTVMREFTLITLSLPGLGLAWVAIRRNKVTIKECALSSQDNNKIST